MTRDEQHRSGERLKKEIKALADTLDRKGRLKLKLALQLSGEISETVARLLMNGDYEKSPRRETIETMEGALASFRKARATA